MSEAQIPPQKPSAWVRFWRFLIRFIFVVVIGILLGAVIYWAVPTIYQQFIQPVQIHGMRLDTLETRLDLYESGADDRMAGMQDRLESLETKQDDDKESLASLQGQVDELESLSATQQAHRLY